MESASLLWSEIILASENAVTISKRLREEGVTFASARGTVAGVAAPGIPEDGGALLREATETLSGTVTLSDVVIQ